VRRECNQRWRVRCFSRARGRTRVRAHERVSVADTPPGGTSALQCRQRGSPPDGHIAQVTHVPSAHAPQHFISVWFGLVQRAFTYW
jgi:hypothetical protein